MKDIFDIFIASTPKLGTAVCPDPQNMVAYGLSCINRRRKKLKGNMKNNKK